MLVVQSNQLLGSFYKVLKYTLISLTARIISGTNLINIGGFRTMV